MANVLIKKNGFTIIEFMVSITIMAVVLAFTLPSFTSWILNMKVRTVAENITLGINNAKNEGMAVGLGSFVIEGNSWKVVDAWKDTPTKSSEGKWDSKVTVEVSPPGAISLMFNNYGLIFNSLDTRFSSQATQTYGIGPITSIRVSATENKPGVTPVRIIINGSTVISCLELPESNQSSISCNNIVLD